MVVEDRATAMREAGDVIQAVADSSLHEDSLVDLADVVTGGVAPDTARPRVFKCVGNEPAGPGRGRRGGRSERVRGERAPSSCFVNGHIRATACAAYRRCGAYG